MTQTVAETSDVVGSAATAPPRVFHVDERRSWVASTGFLFLALAVVPLLLLVALGGDLRSAMEALGIASISGGLWVFLTHGHQRVTAAGVYCLTAGLVGGCGVWYWAITPPIGATQMSIFAAALSVYASTAIMYIAFWHPQRASYAGALQARQAIPATTARSLGLLGVALFAVGVLSQAVRLGTLPTACADMGVVTFAAALLLSGSTRLYKSPIRTILVCAAMLGYYLFIFTGGGRLRLVTLALTLAILAQYRLRFRAKVLAAVLLLPAILALAAIGQIRVETPAHPDAQVQASGLGSLVSPVSDYGKLIGGNLDDGHGSSYAAEALVFVPRRLWPAKPVQFGRTLALELEPQIAATTNQSLAVMPQGEAFFNFSWLGLLLLIPAIGWAVRWLDRRLAIAMGRSMDGTGRVLGFVALCVLVGSLGELAWGGSAAWENRDLERMLVIAPFLLWGWITARAPNRSVQPIQSGVGPTMATVVGVGADRRIVKARTASSSPVRPPASRLTSSSAPLTLSAAPAIEEKPPRAEPFRQMSGRATAFVVDECLSSLQNFVMVFAALHYLQISSLGLFAIGYALVLLIESMLRSLLLLPLSIRFADADASTQREAARRAVGAALTIGVACAAFVALGSLAFHGGARTIMLAAAFAIPCVIVQEAWRTFFFTEGRPSRAALNDGLTLLCTVALLVPIVTHSIRPSAAILLMLWALGTACGADVGMLQTRLLPALSQTRTWMRQNWALGIRLAGAQGADRIGSQVSLAVITALAGTAALGELSASVTLVSPFTTLVVAVSTFAVPEAARLYRRGSGGLRRFIPTVSIMMAASISVFGLLMYSLPDSVGHVVVGPNWHLARLEFLPILIWTGSNAVRSAPLVGLQVMERAKELVRLSVLAGTITVAAVTTGVVIRGASGAAWAFAVSATAVAGIYYGVYHHFARALPVNGPPRLPDTVPSSSPANVATAPLAD